MIEGERIGNSRRYKLTPLGIKLGTLLAKLRTRLLGGNSRYSALAGVSIIR
jgi:hypothetical protein